MTLIIGFALVGACWVWFAYGADIAETVRAVRHLLTEAPPERITRHPWMRAMDELARSAVRHSTDLAANSAATAEPSQDDGNGTPHVPETEHWGVDP